MPDDSLSHQNPWDAVYHAVKDWHAELQHLLQTGITLKGEPGTSWLAHHMNFSGKQLRPLLLFLTARALGCHDPRCVKAAAILEWVHTATLIHDDVVDVSPLRRGLPTMHASLGTRAATAMGNVVLAQAYQKLLELQEPSLLEPYSYAAYHITQGELKQLERKGQCRWDLQAYWDMTAQKTGCLFETSSWMAARLTQATHQQETLARQIGLELGILFQASDDILDFQGVPGKAAADDMREHKMTLPLVCAVMLAGDTAVAHIQKAWQNPDDLAHLWSFLGTCGALDEVIRLLHERHDNLQNRILELPQSSYRASIQKLAENILARGLPPGTL